MAVGFAVAWRLGRTLTRPLTALARTMDAVSRSPLKLVASRPTSSSATSGIAARRP
jgi:hypothetical protein